MVPEAIALSMAALTSLGVPADSNVSSEFTLMTAIRMCAIFSVAPSNSFDLIASFECWLTLVD